VLCFNAHYEPIDFTLPPLEFGPTWSPVIYTADSTTADAKPVTAGAKVAVDARSLMVLQAAADQAHSTTS
jgi:glycogen operon protein